MTTPGWYPDPGGQPGMFRFWDGRVWSAMVSPNPDVPPPPTMSPSLGGSPDPAHVPAGMPPAPTGGKGWIIAAAAVLLVLVVVVGFVVRSVATSGGGLLGGPGRGTPSNRPVCPEPKLETPTTQQPVRDGRVFGGKMSYPQLPGPWSAPSTETRVPFGRDAWTQDILIENFTERGIEHKWVASVLIAELNAGDGFYNPQAGSEIVVTCIVGSFYGDSKVERADRVNRAMTVDGREGWLVESELSFDIPGLKTKGELAIVLIVETSESTASIFYASIPDTSPQWEAPARQAMADLRVNG